MHNDIIRIVSFIVCLPVDGTDKGLAIAYGALGLPYMDGYKDIVASRASYTLKIADAKRVGDEYYKEEKMQDWDVTFQFFKS